jgi:CTP:phosphocholine cytidylyltransferase-like protein
MWNETKYVLKMSGMKLYVQYTDNLGNETVRVAEYAEVHKSSKRNSLCVFKNTRNEVYTENMWGDPGVFITGESFWTPGNHFTDFKDHTAIFKGTITLKID